MEKKNYVKPIMRVVELKHRPCLLGGSNGGPTGEDCYIPNMGSNELNKLA